MALKSEPACPVGGADEDVSAGFTLIEVIAALAILSLSLAVLFATLSGGFYHQGRARHLAEATSLAQSVLVKAGTEFPLQAGTRSGDSLKNYRWELEITAYGTPADRRAWPVDAYRIEAKVFTNDGSAEPVIALSTLRLAPKQAPQ